MAHLAFYTFGILERSLDDARSQEYYALGPAIFSSAAGTDGFIARAPTPAGGRTARFFDPARHGCAVQTLTVWRDLESVYAYAYRGTHVAAFRRRADWFIPRQWSSYAAWWVAEGAMPTWEEAIARFELLHDRGPTPDAFTFKEPFDAAGAPLSLDRARVAATRETVR